VTHPPREPAAAHDRYRLAEGVDADATRKEQVHGLWRTGREDARILEEEGPFLREEQRKTREIRALLVHFDLREVGVVREVERETRRHAVLELAADIPAPVGLRVEAVVPFHTRERVRRHGPHSP